MWVMLSNSFLSIVAHRDQPDTLCVRARVKGDIEAVFPWVEASRTPDGDYLYRAVLPREEVASVLAEKALQISYDNFKSSVPDRDRHDAYLRCWRAMHDLQTMQDAPRRTRFKAKL